MFTLDELRSLPPFTELADKELRLLSENER